MRTLLLLSLLGLAACSSPFEEAWPPKYMTFDADNRTYLVRAQFDPMEQGWFARVEEEFGRLEPTHRRQVFNVVENMVGPKVCKDGKPLKVEPARIWSGHGAKTIRYLPKNGVWQLVGTCA